MFSQVHGHADGHADSLCCVLCRPGAAAVATDGRAHPLFWVNNPTIHKPAVLYRGILTYKVLEEERKQVTDDHSLAIFHYVVRSQKQFIQHKIRENMEGTGVYAKSFAKEVANQRWTGEEEILHGFRRFETKHGLDGDHDICKLGAALSDAYKADLVNYEQ